MILRVLFSKILFLHLEPTFFLNLLKYVWIFSEFEGIEQITQKVWFFLYFTLSHNAIWMYQGHPKSKVLYEIPHEIFIASKNKLHRWIQYTLSFNSSHHILKLGFGTFSRAVCGLGMRLKVYCLENNTVLFYLPNVLLISTQMFLSFFVQFFRVGCELIEKKEKELKKKSSDDSVEKLSLVEQYLRAISSPSSKLDIKDVNGIGIDFLLAGIDTVSSNII